MAEIIMPAKHTVPFEIVQQICKLQYHETLIVNLNGKKYKVFPLRKIGKFLKRYNNESNSF